MTTWRLAVRNTHLYPGARLRCTDIDDGTRLQHGDDALLEFSDGVVVAAQIAQAQPDAATFAVDAHATARGVRIAAKRWVVGPGAAPGELKILRRA